MVVSNVKIEQCNSNIKPVFVEINCNFLLQLNQTIILFVSMTNFNEIK